MRSMCHGDRPEPVVTAIAQRMEYLRSTTTGNEKAACASVERGFH
jgi:hypothetical protein